MAAIWTSAAALVLMSSLLSAAALSAEVAWTRTICDETPRCVGWPSVARLKDGSLLAVFSGRREGHICPYGVVQCVRSADGGETWSAPETIGDTPVDDRDAGVCQLPDGEVLVTWFSSIAYATHPYFAKKYSPGEKRGIDELKGFVDYWCVRSRDGGRTWTRPERMKQLVGSSPHGPVVLKDGSLIHVGRAPAWREIAAVGFDNVVTRIVCERSRDGGRTWKMLCTAVPAVGAEGAKTNYLHEPHVAELTDGRLVALVRCNAADRCFRRTVSSDGGRTWSPLARTSLDAGSTAPHLTALPHGRLLCTYGIRNGDAGIGEFAAVSSDAGETWTRTDACAIHRCGPGIWSGDMGYPSTVALDGGWFLTVYYQPERKGAKSVLMAAKWRLVPGA